MHNPQPITKLITMDMNEQLTALELQESDFIINLAKELFQVLNSKEQEVIKKRFAINCKKQTLEEIGSKFGITRERVRQIEKTALLKLTRVASKTSFQKLITISNEAVKEEAYFATEQKLVQKIISKTSNLFVDNHAYIILSLAINSNLNQLKKSKLNQKSWFSKDKVSKVKVNKIYKISEKILKSEKHLIQNEEFINKIFQELKNEKIQLNKSTITNILESYERVKLVTEGYGLNEWRTVNPKSIKDKAIIVLNRQKKPLHFRTLAKLIHENELNTKRVTVQAVHNELIRYENFVLVGRGIYALKDWGYTDGTVKDIIFKVLKENGPLKKADIVKEVLKQRQVKIGTISLNLQKYPEFVRVGRAVYTLKV